MINHVSNCKTVNIKNFSHKYSLAEILLIPILWRDVEYHFSCASMLTKRLCIDNISLVHKASLLSRLCCK